MRVREMKVAHPLVGRALGGVVGLALLLPCAAGAADPPSRALAAANPTVAGDAMRDAGMSMVTFNLHHDREDWPERRKTILAELKRLQPDAIALQEVIQKRDVRNQAEWLAAKLGYSYQFVSTDPVGSVKRYGNALLTRRPVLARGEHLLAPLGDYRTVAHIRIDVDGRPVNVYATHLNERADDAGKRIRREQVEDLLRFISATSAGAPVVIAGDFNALVDAGDLSELRSHYGDSYGSVHVNNDLSTVSTLNRHYFQSPSRIDHIFFQQDVMLAREARILFDTPDEGGRWASDHYGVWTRLQFAPDPPR
ncbi:MULTISPECIES: endonuclease/exonuclease/phosphatase family protein [unclassified Stenotrophomonas]|uniref:endonuclease/exonuclease/phosphatase family protein n=1 Tax=unclassified Stenotrophomonas TaxID=196198 RepID=UPI001780E219|nr:MULTISPECIES: endonuclease/exonuclease/phosphatase family protein [unclassified Stenotrophomonas]MBD8636264.1 endonuclease/exonuclease/phosphatase family protein [Stenotrophomonas sp. CFBP 13725]MBD8696415.1 endonuclease/exonuclease/phosphatase family protein [Stenotrophomonas sp. CFBP 13718]